MQKQTDRNGQSTVNNYSEVSGRWRLRQCIVTKPAAGLCRQDHITESKERADCSHFAYIVFDACMNETSDSSKPWCHFVHQDNKSRMVIGFVKSINSAAERQIHAGKSGALLAASSHDLQQEAEQVDDVQVDAEGGKNIFLWTYRVALVS